MKLRIVKKVARDWYGPSGGISYKHTTVMKSQRRLDARMPRNLDGGRWGRWDPLWLPLSWSQKP